MQVLVLSPYPDALIKIIREAGDGVACINHALSKTNPDPNKFSFGISYGYRHIVGRDALSLWQDRLINLHISFLPWNRGADPNFWSAATGSPSGVSIHYIDQGVDTGDLIAQAEVPFELGDTLATSYERLHGRILQLFAECWPMIRAGQAARWSQPKFGTMHRKRDRDILMCRLPRGWNTPISEFARIAREQSQS